MKKVLWIFFILLFLSGGFLYVIKNPESLVSQIILDTLNVTIPSNDIQAEVDLSTCTKYFDGCNEYPVQYGQTGAATTNFVCETPAEAQCLEYLYTGMDLTDCVSYFDGCNTCSVKDGTPDVCTEMYCETPSEPKCNEYIYTGADSTNSVGIANPASVNCTIKGGVLEITEGTGGQVGMCTLPNGDICEERAYMRGECGASPSAQSPSVPSSTGVAQENPTACTMEYAPVCGLVAVQCIKAPCPPIEQTFGNKCMLNANSLAGFLHDGECEVK